MIGNKVRARGAAALLAVVGLVASRHAAAQTSVTWTNPANGNWGSAANWTPNQVPNNSGPNVFDATINAVGSSYTVNLDIDPTIRNLTVNSVNAMLDLHAHALVMNGNATVRDARIFAVAGSSMRVNGDLHLANTFIMGITGLNTRGGLYFNSDTTDDDLCDTDVDHEGSVCDWAGNHNILMGLGSTWINGAPSTFTIHNDQSIVDRHMGSTPTFTNRGTIIKSGGTLVTLFSDVALSNTGTIEVQTGTLRANNFTMAGNTLNTGTFIVRAGATLDFPGRSVVTNSANVTLEGSGSTFVQFENNVTANSATGALTVSGGRTFTTNAAFTNNGTLTVANASTFTATSGLTNIDGAGTLTGGTYVVNGTLNVQSQPIRAIAADVTLDGAGADIRNAGVSQINNNLTSVSAAGSLALKNSRTLTTSNTANFANNGTVNIGTGSTLTVDATRTLSNISGGTLTGGTFLIGGTLAVPGQTTPINTISGNVTLDGGGTPLTVTQTLNKFTGNGGLQLLGTVTSITNGSELAVKGGAAYQEVAGAFTVAPTGKLTVGQGSTFEVPSMTNFSGGTFSGGIINVQGTLRLDSAFVNHIDGNITLDGATSQILNGANQDVFSDVQTIRPQGSLAVQNGRNLTTNGALGMLPAAAGDPGPHLNVGATSTVTIGPAGSPANLNQQAGNINLNGGAINLLALNQTGGTLTGNGTINGNLVTNGQIAPGHSPGELFVTGNMTLNHDSVLTMQIAGLGADSFDVISITGGLSMESLRTGTLEVEMLWNPDYIPATGDSFVMMHFAAGQGPTQDQFFEHVRSVTPGFEVSAGFTTDSLIVTITAVPAPGAFALLGAIGIMGSRRRRTAEER